MRILAIRGAGLASLFDPFELDLEGPPLGAAGLFAVTGPTGAGKSTLLDALCLALYGRAPRLEQAERTGRLSAAAGPDRLGLGDPRGILSYGAGEGWAEADFIGRDGRRYRARWSARRARNRASGKLQQAARSLIDLALDQRIGDKARETGQEIEARLGLTFDQFRRAALLAQGEFDAFIRAEPDARAQLLEKITGAEIYGRLSEAAHARAADYARREARLLAEAEGAAPMDPAARAAAEASGSATHAALRAAESVRSAIAARLDWTRRRREILLEGGRASEAVTRARAAMTAATTACAAAASACRAELQAVHARAAAAMAAAPEAAALAGRWTEAQERLDEHVRAEAARRRAARAAAETRETAQRAEAARTEAQTVMATARAARAEAERAAETAESVAAASEAAASSLDLPGLTELTGDLDAARAALVEGRAARASAGEAAAAESAARERRAAAAARRAQGAQERPKRAADLAAADRDRRFWETASGDAAARLRGLLTPGGPCPVCGGRDHAADAFDAALASEAAQVAKAADEAASALRALDVRLAEAAADIAASEERLAEAQGAAARAAHQLAGAAAAWRMAMSAVKERAARSADPAIKDAGAGLDGGEADPEKTLAALDAALAEARGRAVSALEDAQAARRVAAAAAAKAEAARGAERSAAEAQDAARTVSEGSAVAAAAAQEADRAAEAGASEAAERVGGLIGAAAPHWRETPPEALLASLAETVAEMSALKARLAAADAGAALLRRRVSEPPPAIDALSAPSEAVWRLAADGAEAAGALLAPLDAAEAAAEDAGRSHAAAQARRAAAQEALAAWDAQQPPEPDPLEPDPPEPNLPEPNLQGGGADPAAASTDVPIDTAIAALEAAMRSAEQAAADARSAQEEAALTLAVDDAARQRAGAAEARRAALAEEAAPWKALDALIGSADGKKFRNFAQGLTLQRLAVLANAHLAELQPRYRLSAPPAEDPSAASLHLEVLDLDLGGAARGVRNLSGGERFLVSLALALALGNLAAETGAAAPPVANLFIDEGFGALDAESLSLAVSALEALQATGRRVGVISHVDALQERISVKVVVTPQGGGRSRIALQTD